MLANGVSYDCPSLKDIPVVDTTGGGNSSSGAVLYACCEGYSPKMAGCMGSAAAAVILAQYGVPAQYTPAMRETAMKQAQGLCNEDK